MPKYIVSVRDERELGGHTRHCHVEAEQAVHAEARSMCACFHFSKPAKQLIGLGHH